MDEDVAFMGSPFFVRGEVRSVCGTGKRLAGRKGASGHC